MKNFFKKLVSRKILLALLVTIIFLIIVSFVLNNLKEETESESTSSSKSVEKIVDDCYKSYQKDVRAGLNLAMDREMCYINAASKLRDYKICSLVEDGDIRNQCLRTVGEETNDISICDMVIEGKNSCYFHVATQLKDVSICEKIDFSNDTSYDSKISRNDCYSSLAKLKKDVSLCEKITNEERLRECIKNAEFK
jgi:hypothetical protein